MITLPINALHPKAQVKLPAGTQRIDVCPHGYTAKRTNPQNKLYWEWLGIIAKDTGHTDEELHEYFKNKFLPAIEKKVMGNRITIYPTTTKLNKAEFSAYLNSVEDFAWHTLGIALPHPKETNS